MNSASYHKLVISTALCRVSISTCVLQLINFKRETMNFGEGEREEKKIKKHRQHYASRTSNVELCFRTEPYTIVSNAASSHNTLTGCL